MTDGAAAGASPSSYRDVVAALVATAVAVGAVLAVGTLPTPEESPAAASIPEGYVLGPERGMSEEEYAAVARESLADVGPEPAFGLVRFTRPLRPEEVDTLFPAGSVRLNAVILGHAQPLEIPEPVPGSAGHDTRAEVITAALDRVNASMGGLGDVPRAKAVDAVVVYAPGEALRQIAGEKAVKTLELAPPDAVWGHVAVHA
ncbi:hypothetical protein H0194_01950 [Corynebacterium incognita]|uniref:Uncharacterized protein n=1 Tax=Corynebacterium incognita TaxID=2754725 RepID=A0A7G7CQH3_9CORY|nr:hypothetical protein [Corynebacterium incognita]QNE89839.1 hypothetical protein H0194_01950 [Corynebacterium incognita]